MKLFFSMIAIVIFIVCNTAAHGSPHNHTSVLHSQVSFDLLNPSSEITLHLHKNSNLNLKNISEAISEIRSKIGKPYITGSCASKMKLSVYIIPYDILNNRQVMKKMINWPTVGPERIVGIFDNRHEYSNGFIYVADAYGENEVISTVAHEMYHAKQRADCMSGPEDDAVNFEESFCNTVGYC